MRYAIDFKHKIDHTLYVTKKDAVAVVEAELPIWHKKWNRQGDSYFLDPYLGTTAVAMIFEYYTPEEQEVREKIRVLEAAMKVASLTLIPHIRKEVDGLYLQVFELHEQDTRTTRD